MPYDRSDEYEDEARGRSRERLYRHNRVGSEGGRGHAAVGIASCLVALLSGVMVFALVVVAGVLSSTRGELSEDSPEAILIGLGIIAGIGLAVLALILGVIGLFQQNDKLFPILGTTFSGLVLLGSILIICAGLLAG